MKRLKMSNGVKKILTAFSVLAVVLVLSGSAWAAVFRFEPASVAVSSGSNFSVSIVADPQDAKNYTAKIELKYPADMLEVKSFAFNSAWFPLSMPNYDLLDNTNGVLIKTAGYPKGFSAPATFGTVTFRAKKEGSVSISLGGNSVIFDAQNKNVLTGAPVVAVNVSKAVISEQPAGVMPLRKTATTPAEGGVIQEQVVTQGAAQNQNAAGSVLASSIAILSLGTDNMVVLVLVCVALISALTYTTVKTVKRRRKNKSA